ncbi:cell wall-binding repeat-containing protein, partial [Kineococcus glutinatus]|uniref:cell wall-binding repeat-containing protein n=1 Tax=Kineococcus glutinatus TaxID=1070872 RepID=UPI0031ECB9F3
MHGRRRTAVLTGIGVLVVVVLTATALATGADPAADAATTAPPTVERIAGADRYATAAALSRQAFGDRPGRAVFLVGGSSVPDALVAAPAAAAVSAPLLLTNGQDLSPATAAELQRLQPSVVHVIGGPGDVSGVVEAQLRALLPAARVQRTAGADRHETAVLVARQFFPVTTTAVVTADDGSAGAPAAAAAAQRSA